MESVLSRAAHIKWLILDVDGVLTDGRIYALPNQQELKVFHIHDGLGIKLLQQHGIQVGVISGRQCPIVSTRLQDLGVQHIYQGIENKLPVFESLCREHNISLQNVAYVGDDLLDIPLLRRAGLGIAVANAQAVVKEFAHWQTTQAGGHGAVREVCELLLKAQNKLTLAYESFLV